MSFHLRLLRYSSACVKRGIQHMRPITSPYSISIRTLTAANHNVDILSGNVRQYVDHYASITKPSDIHVCTGSAEEKTHILEVLQNNGMIKPLPKYENCWIAHTDPADVARVESKTFMSTPNKRDTVPLVKEGVDGVLGNWWSPADMKNAFDERFPGCMAGRTMYVIPFSMGPVGSPLSKIGIELTDSPYVVASMYIMTRVGSDVLSTLGNEEFVKCLHSVGRPLPMDEPAVNNWPCNPAKTMIAHIPERNEIISFGSGYGGNSLLGKKCFALRLGGIIAKKEGWLAEHMLILGITNPQGVKKYIAAAFPSACGKTNLAMMQPTIPGYKVECVGDDIAWMRFDKDGRLRAINPEAGFFGVAPGTSNDTNPYAMATIQRNTVFTNVAETSDGGFYWEGLEKETSDDVTITSWLGKSHVKGTKTDKAAHPNSRFCTPAEQCPIMDPAWEDSAGVPIDAIVFGGRRPAGVPLVYESFDWNHGVFIGASMRSEATAAAEHKAGKVVMHDPFAMRPFFGYNFGHYLQHWLNFNKQPNLQLPKIFHVNWFRKNTEGKFIWPGFGENCRVLDWICRRVDNEDCADKTAIGMVPQNGSLPLDGLEEGVDMKELFHLPKDFWTKEVQEIRKYFNEQVNEDLPEEVANELNKLEARVKDM